MRGDRWTHSICAACWNVEVRQQAEVSGDKGKLRRLALQPGQNEPEHCCFCGGKAKHGIYVRRELAEAKHCLYRKPGGLK